MKITLAAFAVLIGITLMPSMASAQFDQHQGLSQELQHQREYQQRMERQVREMQNQNPWAGGEGPWEQGTPLNPEAAAEKEESESASGMLKTLGYALFICFAFILVGLGIYTKRAMGDGQVIDSSAAARTIAQIKKERATPEELAGQFFDALRFGSFPQYRALFVSPADAETFLSMEKLSSYLHGTMEDRNVQRIFRRLTEICNGAKAQLKSVRASDTVQLQTPRGGVVELVSSTAIAVELPTGGLAKIPLGSMVRLDGNWKLFVPLMPEGVSSEHPVQQPSGPSPSVGGQLHG